MADKRLTKRVVDGLKPGAVDRTEWDSDLPGFGVRVRPSGAMTFILRYRPGGGRNAPIRRIALGAVGAITVDEARKLAREHFAKVRLGSDPALERRERRDALTLDDLADLWLAEHIEAKRKPATAGQYRHMLDHYIRPVLGSKRAAEVTRADVAKLHISLTAKRHTANRCLAVIGSMFSWAGKCGLVGEDVNPARKVETFKEAGRERFLSSEELERLGATLRLAETKGLPWSPDPDKKVKHAPKEANRRAIIAPEATAAIRLLLFTGCRLREILHLEWVHVDTERGLLRLPDSKTGAKTVVLSGPAITVLTGLPRVGRYVIPGLNAGTRNEKPRADLHRPWAAVARHAKLEGVRLHDLRHSFASVGAGASLGLPVLGRLLGHTQARTTQRYSHLDADPLRRASNLIAGRIAAAIGEASPVKEGEGEAEVLPFQRGAA